MFGKGNNYNERKVKQGEDMCTAITYYTKDHYFGRNLDYELSYNEEVVITPRNYCFDFRDSKIQTNHYAMIGMAYVVNNYPLYYDATNEKGLSMAGLLFSKNAHYYKEKAGKDNIASFEFIPWILRQCKDVEEARKLLDNVNVTTKSFNSELQPSPLHWIIADQKESIVVETMKEGMKVYHNPIGVLTNNPPFPYQIWNLNNYMHLTAEPAKNRFSPMIDMETYSKGMGGIGLPGDLSSASRFVRATFVKFNAIAEDTESSSVGQFFHILGAVEQQKGCVSVNKQVYEKTIYSSCCNMDKGIYYYVTYDNRQINAVDMRNTNLDDTDLKRYPLDKNQAIKFHV